MQYLWKITVLGVSQQVNRLVALEGDLPLESVLSLCNLAFDYDNYPEKALYFAQNPQANKLGAGRQLLDSLVQLPDDRYGAEAKEFWKEDVGSKVSAAVAQGQMLKLDLQAQPALKLEFATQVLQEQLAGSGNEATGKHQAAAYADEMQQALDAQPNSLNLNPRFLYELHGVWHLVEVMKCSQKLMCFIPSCLAGRGCLTDDEQKLSVEEIERQFKAQAEQEEASGQGVGLDLRACTARMRALQTDLGNDKVNDVMLQAGATPLKFK